jgi:hypothetical protein
LALKFLGVEHSKQILRAEDYCPYSHKMNDGLETILWNPPSKCKYCSQDCASYNWSEAGQSDTGW